MKKYLLTDDIEIYLSRVSVNDNLHCRKDNNVLLIVIITIHNYHW